MHVPALIAALLLPVVVYVVRRLRAPVLPGREEQSTVEIRSVPLVRQWAAWLLGVSAAVHLALPLGHYDGPLLTAAFLGSGAAYAWLAIRAWRGARWRLFSGLLLAATLVAYLVVTDPAARSPTRSGIATALVELVALGLCFVPSRPGERPKRFKRFAGSTGTILVTFVVGVVVWVGSFAAHAATDNDVSADPQAAGAALGHSGDHEHAHDHAARAQAGVDDAAAGRPSPHSGPTGRGPEAGRRDQGRHATRSRTWTRRSRPGSHCRRRPTGPDVHLENKANRSDGRMLDPRTPGDAGLRDLGRQGDAARGGVRDGAGRGRRRRSRADRSPAGTRTTSVSPLLPPGFGIVSPFGSCPAFSINLTTPEMMHVWVVDNPSGPVRRGTRQGLGARLPRGTRAGLHPR